MNLIKSSCILSLISAFFDLVAQKICESAIWRGIIIAKLVPLWKIIDRKWDESFCMLLLRKIGRHFQSGFGYAFFVRRPIMDRWVEESSIIRLIMWVANLVPNLLGRFYRRFPKIFDGSLFFTCILDKLPFLVLCALALIMFVTPQEMWNNMYALLLAVAALGMFWLAGMRNPDRRLSVRGIGGWTIMFFFVNLMSTFWSIDLGTSLRYMAFWITALIVIVVLVSLVRNELQLSTMVAVLSVGLLIASAYAIMQRLGGLEADEVLSDLKLNAGMPGRVYSFFENPNSFANVLVLFAPVMLTMGLDRKHKARSVYFLAVFLLSMLALVMTYSRGGWIAIALSVFTLMLIAKPEYAPLLIVVGCAALPILPDNIVNRIITIFTGDSSISTRMYLYDGAFGAIASSPVIGVGLGSEVAGIAATASGRYLLTETMPFVHAHNLYFEIWAESGLIGLVSFLLAMFYGLQRAGSAARRKDAPLAARRVCAGFMAAFAGSLFFGVTDYPWCYPRVMVMYWLAFAVMCAAARQCDSEKTLKEI